MRYKITFSYDGSVFNGYEKQPKLKTVQGTIEDILTSINNNKKVILQSSGRTDKGVHAINQVAHFDLDTQVKAYGIKQVLNKRSNKEIYIKDVELVSDKFHARYDVLEKTYSYYINIGEYNVFKRNYEYQYNKTLNVNKMLEAITYFMGTHDFRSFCKEEKVKENCIRTITKATIEQKGDIIKITFTANGFLRKMVRNIVGLLIEIGCGKKQVIEAKEILDSRGKIHQTKSAPGVGLYLENVKYNGD